MALVYQNTFGSDNNGLQVGHNSGNIYYGFEHEKNLKQEVLLWLSNVPNRKHHAAIWRGILPDSGQWLMQKDAYLEWVSSSSSSMLWLHGIPGCGKTRLIAHMIQKLWRQQGFAYFYCTRDAAESKRADPEEILRSLLRQLLTPGELRQSALDIYRERKTEAEKYQDEITALTIEECMILILEIAAEENFILIIDALDECDPNKRHHLMNALDEIVHKAVNGIKILISSRDDQDIVMRMNDTLNIWVSASDNNVDIEQFVQMEIDRAIQDKRLLGGTVSEELRKSIKSAITRGAQGMFQWVNLVVQNLCEFHRLQLAEDIMSEIAKLPSGLRDLYGLALHRIHNKSPRSRDAAVCVLRWLLGAQISLCRREFTEAVSKMTGTRLEPQKVLDLCDNLIVVDIELDIFRFAHFSIREFLELDPSFQKTSIHSNIGLQCLQIFNDCPRALEPYAGVYASSLSYEQYACLYWPVHFFLAGQQESPILEIFLEFHQDGWPRFERWVAAVARSPTWLWIDEIRFRMKLSFGASPHPIFLAIAFEFQEYVVQMANKLVGHPVNQYLQSPLALACTLGNQRAFDALISSGADLDVKDIVNKIQSRYPRLSTNPLAAAILGEHWSLMRTLIKAGADINLDASRGVFGSPLMIAIRSGLLWLVQELVKSGAHLKDPANGSTLLQTAARDGYADICCFLIDHGAHKHGAIRMAASNSHLDIVQVLLDSGVSVDEDSPYWGTALAQAAWQGHVKVIEFLLERHAQPLIASGPYGTPFLSAVAGGNIEIIKKFLEYGADINDGGSTEGNALVIAAHCNKDDALSFLLKYGADVERPTLYHGRMQSTKSFIAEKASFRALKELVGYLPSPTRAANLDILLSHTFLRENISEAEETITWLLDNGAQPNYINRYGTTPIHLAVSRQDVTLVRLLLDRNVGLNMSSEEFGSPLQALYLPDSSGFWFDNPEGDEDEIFDLLIDKGVDIHCQGGPLGNALQAASYRGATKHCEKLLELGVKDSVQGGYFDRPLVAAAAMGHSSIVKLLLQHQFDVNATSEEYGCALQAAACLGRKPILTSFTNHRRIFASQRELANCSISMTPSDPSSYQEIFQILLDHEAEVSPTGGRFGTALQAASYAGQITMVEQLLKRGASVRVRSGLYGSCLQAACCKDTEGWLHQDNWSETSVIFQEEGGGGGGGVIESDSDSYIKVINLLLAHGADVNEEGGLLGTALQAACYSCDPQIVQHLLDKGADICEGSGLYGGCVYASMSFGKARALRKTRLHYWDDARVILKTILVNISSYGILEVCQGAIVRANEEYNKDGIRLLREVLSEDSSFSDLLHELLWDADEEL